jgi:phosphatidylserine/phosphatidylglycerophosphate/cardiolipin synthase-like enzyme
MSNSVTGRIVDEHGASIAGVFVQVLQLNQLHGDVPLGVGQSDQSGFYNVPFDPAAPPMANRGTLRVRAFDSVGRLLKSQDVQDTSSSVDLVVNLMVQTSTSTPGVDVTDDGAFYNSDGNTIEFLIDDESAWQRLTDAVHTASRYVHLQQYVFDISEFDANPAAIKPTLITEFAADPVAGMRVDKVQLERELADASARGGVEHVYVVMHHSALWRPPALWTKFWEPLLDLILALFLPDDSKRVESYFGGAAAGPPPLKPVEVRRFGLDRTTHAKLLIVDQDAFLIGSPFIQDYFDRTHFPRDASGNPLPPVPTHQIGELRRGGSGSWQRIPIHEISLRIRGPAVADVDRAFLLHWNAARPDKSVLGEVPAPAPPPQPGGVKVQVVRTLCKGRFDDPRNGDTTNPRLAEGEQGVLAAYKIAISKAERFIYIENQYFVEPQITEALVDRMRTKSDVQLILLLNNSADIPFYSGSYPVPILSLLLSFAFEGRQQLRLQDLLRGLLEPQQDAKTGAWPGMTPDVFNARVGMYTLWSHEPASSPQGRSRIINNYVHSKAAIIDDTWATVGSANLDEFSLLREHNSEVNAVLFDDATAQITDFRQRLWAEHLGIDPSQVGTAGDFVKLWADQSNAKLAGLRNKPPQVSGCRVLPWPPFPHTGTNIAFDVYSSDKYLQGLGIDTRALDVLQRVVDFDFATGKAS